MFKVILCASEQICLLVWYCYRSFKKLKKILYMYNRSRPTFTIYNLWTS